MILEGFDFNENDDEQIKICNEDKAFPVNPDISIGDLLFKKSDLDSNENIEFLSDEELARSGNKRGIIAASIGLIVGLMIPYYVFKIDMDNFFAYFFWAILFMSLFGFPARNDVHKKNTIYYIGEKGISQIVITNSKNNHKTETIVLFNNVKSFDVTKSTIKENFTIKDIIMSYCIKDFNGTSITTSYNKKAHFGDKCNYLLCKNLVKNYLSYKEKNCE